MDIYLPRGVRNNNPGNIERDDTVWQGMAADQSADPRFVVFSAPEWGIRALAKVLLSYYRRHGLRTVVEIVARWAPPGENDGQSYAEHVAAILGVPPDQTIEMDAATLGRLVQGVIAHENANYAYPPGLIAAAIDMAIEDEKEA